MRVNLFPVTFPQGELYHYDVTITPKCPKRINRVVFEALMKTYAGKLVRDQKPAFDGNKNMYCRKQLPIPDGKVKEKKLDKLVHVSKTLKLGVGVGFWKIPSDLYKTEVYLCYFPHYIYPS